MCNIEYESSNIKVALMTSMFILLITQAYPLATNICDFLKIPYDLALTISSCGMRLELTIILSLGMTIIMYNSTKIIAFVIFKILEPIV